MKAKSFLYTLITLCIMYPLLASGQQGDTLELKFNPNGKVSFGRFKANNNSERKLSTSVVFLKGLLNAKSEDEFRLQKSEVDELGMTHQHYQQYFRGIKVEGGVYSAHGKNDDIEVVNGDFADINLSTVNPTKSEKDALKAALNFINAKKYAWEDKASEKMYRELMNDPNATQFPKGDLVIVKAQNSNQNWVLAWSFTISSLEPYDAQLIFVDASTGSIANKITLICESNSPGTAETRYSGTRSFTTDSFTSGNSAYRLRESRNGVSIQTMNMQRTTNWANAIDFIDFDNNWTAAEHNNAFKDQVGMDTHWAVEKILDYWKNVHNRNSLDNNGLPVWSGVHFGNNIVNAFWDGAVRIMYFGDGNNTTYSPLTSIDVAAHEFGHGVDQFSSNLTYQGESGALDESIADIWGEVIQYWSAPEKQRWLMGEEFGTPFRSMNNPNLYQDPDTYGGTHWIDPSSGFDNGGVHINSGVGNFWFYLLTEGGIGTNDLNNCYNVTGIGMTKSAAIVYRSQRVNYLQPNSTYLNARDAMIQSARDLYGNNSQEVISVTNAWYAVGVGAAYQHNSNDIVGANIICYPGATLTLIGAPAGATVTWNVTSGLFSPSSGTGTVANLQAVSSTAKGYATLTFSFGTCNGSTIPVSKALWLGVPSSGISGDPTPYPGQLYTYTASGGFYEGAGAPYLWVVSGGTIYGGGGPSSDLVTVFWFEDGFVELTTGNACGSYTNTMYIYPTLEGGCDPCQIQGFYPNPTSTVLNVDLNNNRGERSDATVILYDKYQIVYSKTTKGNQVVIPVANLPAGMYFLKVTDSTGSQTKHVLIDH